MKVDVRADFLRVRGSLRLARKARKEGDCKTFLAMMYEAETVFAVLRRRLSIVPRDQVDSIKHEIRTAHEAGKHCYEGKSIFGRSRSRSRIKKGGYR
jgi:hypothetical protein